MYCRKCGNKIGDTDHYCQVCGTPTGYEEPTAPTAETDGMREEVVFNPPYENKSHFMNEPIIDEEELSEPEVEEDLKEFISENEIEAQKEEEGESEKSDSSKDSEFTWNIYEFPSSRKTEEIVFNWNMEDYNKPEEKGSEPVPFEEEFFREIREDSNRIKEQNIDRFFTFSRKNEEFQELLDREYEKLNLRAEPESEPECPGMIITESGMPEAVTPREIPRESEMPEEVIQREPEVPEEVIQRETEVSEEVIRMEPEVPGEFTQGEDQLSEMARARAQFFGEELIRDNESIKKKLVTEAGEEEAEPETAFAQETATEGKAEFAEVTAAETEPVAIEVTESEPGQESEPENEIVIESETESESELFPLSYKEEREKEMEMESTPAPIPVFNTEAEEEDDRPKRGIGQILLIILAVILFVEIVILGIRYFAPESAASKAIGNTQTQIFKTFSGWADGINDLFSGKDSNEDEGGLDDGNTGQDNDGQDKSPGEQPDDSATDKPAPDPNPTADKNALISSQMGNNKNILQVKPNDALVWKAGQNYGLSDINKSKPISNNIWQTPENGDPVYYDESVAGAVIAFDSLWIDYVNDGSKGVFDFLKKDSEAYRKTLAFSKVGKVKESFKLLEIGEIRQGAKGFYVWVHEEIQITEKGTTTDKKYNWIYYLEPSDTKMQIVNYFKF